MWTGYTLFNDFFFHDYDDLRKTIREQLGDIESRPEEERVRIKPPEPPRDELVKSVGDEQSWWSIMRSKSTSGTQDRHDLIAGIRRRLTA